MNAYQIKLEVMKNKQLPVSTKGTGSNGDDSPRVGQGIFLPVKIKVSMESMLKRVVLC